MKILRKIFKPSIELNRSRLMLKEDVEWRGGGFA